MRAVILINFGGPRSVEEVYPFLKELFRDVLPTPMKVLATLIARLRLKKSTSTYEAIGGASPVVSWTRWQAQLLEKGLVDSHCDPERAEGEAISCSQLNSGDCRVADDPPATTTSAGKRNDGAIKVYIGMQYGSPSIEDAIAEANKDGASKIILLPLYPYKSRYTSLQVYKSAGLQVVTCWHNHPLYIRVMVDIITKSLKGDEHILFSAHAVPLSSIKDGDPYVDQIKESTELVMKEFPGYSHSLAFQSQAGPSKWTGPTVKEALCKIVKEATPTQTLPRPTTKASAGKQGGGVNGGTCKHVLIVPLGFACENIETLYEIDKIYILYAKNLGLKISRAPTLNDHPQFIDLLRQLVLDSTQ